MPYCVCVCVCMFFILCWALDGFIQSLNSSFTYRTSYWIVCPHIPNCFCLSFSLLLECQSFRCCIFRIISLVLKKFFLSNYLLLFLLFSGGLPNFVFQHYYFCSHIFNYWKFFLFVQKFPFMAFYFCPMYAMTSPFCLRILIQVIVFFCILHYLCFL